jgi:ferredoxin
MFLFSFGTLGVLFGVMLILWILYNELISRQDDYEQPPLWQPFGVAPALIGMGAYWLSCLRRSSRQQDLSPMSQVNSSLPQSIPGKYYITDQCTDCDLCRECAPMNIRRDDQTGRSYVFKQPNTDDEIALVEDGVQGCPTEAVKNDGDKFDWRKMRS